VVESGGKMPSFSGTHYYTIDQKGRLIIPAPFREIISANYSTKLYIVNAAFDRCLHIYPLEEWSKFEEKVRALPKMDEAVKFLMRRVIGSAVESEMDKQGRVLIPASLRENSGISGEIVIVGQIEKIEIWDRKEWDSLFDPSKIDKKAYEERLANYGV